MREVCDRVGAHARGHPHQEVRAELEEVFREIDQWMPPAELDLMARSMADPWWAIKHPVEAARVRQALEAEDTDVDDDEDDDPVSLLVERFDDAPRWLGKRSARVVGVAQRRTFDGWAYQVSTSPWSDRLAHKVRKRCAGYDVRVVEHAPGCPPYPDGIDIDERAGVARTITTDGEPIVLGTVTVVVR